MTELYRGILEILIMRCVEQIESLRAHIRSHNQGKSSDSDFDMEVSGFWNLMLETIFTIFTIFFSFLFVCLAASLAIASYPFAAWFNYGTWLLKNTRGTAPTQSESPIIIKKNNGQEKE